MDVDVDAAVDRSFYELQLDPHKRKKKFPAKVMSALKLITASAFTSTLVIYFTLKITFLFALGILTLSEWEPWPAQFNSCLFYIVPLGAAHMSPSSFSPPTSPPNPHLCRRFPALSEKIMQLKPIFFGANIAQLTALIWWFTVETESYRKLLYCFGFTL